MLVLDHGMPSASVAIDHFTEESFSSAQGGATVVGGEGCKGRFDQHRPLGTIDFASKYVEQRHRPPFLSWVPNPDQKILRANQEPG